MNVFNAKESRIVNDYHKHAGYTYNEVTHHAYCNKVVEEFNKFRRCPVTGKATISPKRMTAEQAKAFVDHLKSMPDTSLIGKYNKAARAAARSPWQLLYRLSRIVVLVLVLVLGWILVVVQPDLARRLMLPQTPRFQQRVALHREQVQGVLRAAVAAHGFGLHSLMVAEWDGASSLNVLAVQGRTLQLPLQPGEETLVGVAMAKVMGHVALGLCESERPTALSIDEAQLPAGSTLLVCPIGCAASSAGQGVLVGIFAPAVRGAGPGLAEGLQPRAVALSPAGVGQDEQRLRRKREQLMVLARRLAGVLQ